MEKIGVLTRDCAGINAAIRSVVRTALEYNIEVVGTPVQAIIDTEDREIFANNLKKINVKKIKSLLKI